MVREMYMSDANIPKSKYILAVLENGTLRLKWYSENTVVVEKEPIMTKMGSNNATMIEFGDVNLFGIRQHIPFLNGDGKLDERWVRIK